jgi:hypothetical protein
VYSGTHCELLNSGEQASIDTKKGTSWSVDVCEDTTIGTFENTMDYASMSFIESGISWWKHGGNKLQSGNRHHVSVGVRVFLEFGGGLDRWQKDERFVFLGKQALQQSTGRGFVLAGEGDRQDGGRSTTIEFLKLLAVCGDSFGSVFLLYDNGDVVEILEAPSHIRKRLSIACLVIILLSMTAWSLALWYQGSVKCQQGARLWCAFNIFTSIFISWLAPFNATLRRTCVQHAAFLTGVLAATAQVAGGCYLIAVSGDIHCMMESVIGGFMFVLLVLEASLLGSVLGLTYSGYRLY